MKLLHILLALVFLAMPCIAMTDTQAAYLEGFNDGWHLLYLRFTDPEAFNTEVQLFNDEANASLNASEAAEVWLAPYSSPALNYTLPEVFQ